MAETSNRNIVDRAATFEPSPHYFCKSSIPISIPISTKGLLSSLVQEHNRYKGGGSMYMECQNPSTKIREDHYPLPFIEPYYEKFQGVYRGGHNPPFREPE
ncbi:S ribonuclease [Pyrus ussuriensis x Pyrus communis]|uniref:S ribonuclease n=1 Tax=Pyrus ussuriensis x Pyrus communis TaxID=2448454 RepID=A0A5N5FMB9_9ROSA|nr:S ribonuclease [Pyrus ussuriensis x Pyrus communis]